MGVAHHTHYFVWFELGRTELMREAGFLPLEIIRAATTSCPRSVA